MSSNYVCQNCSKTYKRHSYFLKHQLECRCMDNLLREPISIETLKIPSTIQQTLEFLITSNRELKENFPSRSAKLRCLIKKENFYDFKTDILDKFKDLIEIENLGLNL